MTVLPPIFDTIPDLGSTKLRATFLYPFLHLRERFDTLEVVVIFSSFWAGKSPRHAKIGCVVVHHCHGVSRHNKRKNAKGRDPNMMNGREMVFSVWSSEIIAEMEMISLHKVACAHCVGWKRWYI
jgi:hypothetical protein